ncbi:GNAT family N-acetyltransferase [Maribacter litopenaei]|uniref:GNAT family N-acetyltransferase n=1 Tax=Maribacter litopenaei TaxID=2976127 RepID=A0ABY5YDI8_9FLAO|nr:GNAT family N-acetyltransferase [Maribacter litopenaei]UWX56264.1 GNAT family N-acetyltransferase [Maribacter litopenaei]
MVIESISAQATWPLRHQVMWPNLPLDFVKLENDVEGYHYGIFCNENIVSCISLFVQDGSAQFRKLATKQEFQRKGYASELIIHVVNICRQMKLKKIWCNSRMDKTDFYENFGLAKTNECFIKGG